MIGRPEEAFKGALALADETFDQREAPGFDPSLPTRTGDGTRRLLLRQLFAADAGSAMTLVYSVSTFLKKTPWKRPGSALRQADLDVDRRVRPYGAGSA